MRKITTGEVLRALCEEIPLTKNDHIPITKSRFKNAMLSSELFTSRTSINMRWDQLYNKIELVEKRGTLGLAKMPYIVLDPQSVERALKNENLPLPFDWEGVYTHTHTQTIVKSEESQ